MKLPNGIRTLLFSSVCALASPQQDLDDLAGRLVASLPEGMPTVAVLPLQGDSPEEANGISEYLVAFLGASGRVTLVERAQFHQAMSELALSQTGAVSDEQSLAVGKALSARYLLLGSIGELMGKRRVNLRLVETETGKIVESGGFTTGTAELQALPKELLGESGQMSAAIYRSAVAPGWGQFYTDHPVRGSIALVAFLGSVSFMGYSFYQAAGYDNDASDLEAKRASNSGDDALKAEFAEESGLSVGGSGFQQAYNDWYSARLASLRSDRDDANGRAMIGLGVTLGVYALNLVDAAFCGVSQKRKFDLYFSAYPTSQGTSGFVQLAWNW